MKNSDVADNRFNAKQWIWVCLMLRLAVMPFAMHGDLLFVYGTPHFLAHGQWDAYGIAAEKFDKFYYPPLTMILFACVQWVFRFLFSGYETFTHSIAEGGRNFIFDSNDLFFTLFLLKLPYLVSELALIWVCWRMLPDEEDKRAFTALWAVNPLVIYGEYVIGQMGLMPAFCVVLACYFSLQKGKAHYACLSLGLGCLLKMFPIIFLPVVLCLTSRNLKDSVRLSLYCFIPIAIGFGLFYMVSGAAILKVIAVTSSASQQTGMLPGWVVRIVQAAIYGAVCIHILVHRKQSSDYVFQYFLVVYLALYLSSSVWQTYYFVWFVPFAILYVQKRVALKKWFYCFMLVIFMSGLRSRESAFGAFAPLNPELFLSIPSLKDVVGFLFNLSVYNNTLAFAFYALNLLLLSIILKNLFFPRHDGGADV